ncbi:MAG: hypothetical protein M3R49_04175 [Chloroflexota bacterium]|nr:hypothetical protein [Chloroflexota bacterium]
MLLVAALIVLIGCVLIVTRALDREIRAEESRLSSRFGAAYAAYRARVPRYVPVLWNA